MVGERPLVRALGHTVAALEAVGAEHRVLNPQVRRAVGRVREQAFFRLIFLLHTPVPPATPGATTRQLPDGAVLHERMEVT